MLLLPHYTTTTMLYYVSRLRIFAFLEFHDCGGPSFANDDPETNVEKTRLTQRLFCVHTNPNPKTINYDPVTKQQMLRRRRYSGHGLFCAHTNPNPKLIYTTNAQEAPILSARALLRNHSSSPNLGKNCFKSQSPSKFTR
jgi:hypothetical protein